MADADPAATDVDVGDRAAVGTADFVTWSEWALARVGFRPTNTLALVGVCRDELMHGFERDVAAVWGRPFEIGSLAGMLFIGHTGLRAALSHAPGEDGRHRLAAFCFSHIGIDAAGRVGRVQRRGLLRASAACGALVALRTALADGQRVFDLDPADPEQSLLGMRLAPLLVGSAGVSSVPSLPRITSAAARCAATDLRDLVAAIGSDEPVNVAYLSGIVVHGADGVDRIVDVAAEVVIDRARIDLAF